MPKLGSGQKINMLYDSLTEKNNEVQNLECSFLVMDPVRRKEVWRFITYMLLHANHQHIGYNLLMQLLIGRYLYSSNCKNLELHDQNYAI